MVARILPLTSDAALQRRSVSNSAWLALGDLPFALAAVLPICAFWRLGPLVSEISSSEWVDDPAGAQPQRRAVGRWTGPPTMLFQLV